MMNGRTGRVGASYTPGLGRADDLIGFNFPVGSLRGCQYIKGDPHGRGDADAMKCGVPRDPDRPLSPYCAEHWKLTHKDGTDLSDRSEPAAEATP